MKTKYIYILLLPLVFLLSSFTLSTYIQKHSSQKRFYFELPKIRTNDQIINHYAYNLGYRKDHHEAEWAAYMLTKKRTIKKFTRTDDFRIDPAVKSGSADPSDYAGSGYDQGHLVPCNDMRWSKKAESESFYMSNMTPQTHSFNAGIWKKLESWVHKYAQTYDTIYVATGPILQKGLKTIGANKVSVPKYFYKVFLVYKQNENKCIGFIVPHKKSPKDIMTFAVSVDSVEKRTGINFFALVPDSIQKRIETFVDISQWEIK